MLMLKYLLSQRGEVGDEQTEETAPEQADFDWETAGTEVDSDNTDTVGTDTIPGDAPDAQASEETPAEESFLDGTDLDPTKLSPELQAHFKRMQASFTRKMQGLSEARQKAEMVDRFYSDPNFARQTLVDFAAQNGMQLVPIGQAAQTQPTAQSQQMSADVVAQSKQQVPEEFHWMVDMLAPAINGIIQQNLSPIAQAAQTMQQSQQQAAWQSKVQSYQQEVQRFSERNPTWIEHEDTMAEIANFLKSDALSHPKYGSKLELLHKLATGDSAGLVKAAERMRQGVQTKRPSSPSATSRVTPNFRDRIMQAKGANAFDLAAQAAEAQLRSK